MRFIMSEIDKMKWHVFFNAVLVDGNILLR